MEPGVAGVTGTLALVLALVIALLSGAVGAFLGPVGAEAIKRLFFSPNLRIGFRLEPPWCHRTTTAGGWPVFYFRISVENGGRSQARRCEAVLEGLWIRDAAGQYIREANFFGVNLVWSVIGSHFADLNPERRLYCDIGFIPEPGHQQVYFQDRPEFQAGDRGRLNFFFSQVVFPFVQRSYVGPGSYEVQIIVYSENSGPVRRRLRIDWSGTWREDEREMFREIVIAERPAN